MTAPAVPSAVSAPAPARRIRALPRAVVVVLAVMAAGGAAAVLGPVAAALVGGFALAAVTAYRPVTAVYLYLLALPFLAGIDRDRLLPFVRPHEALLVLLLAGAAVGGLVRVARGADLRPRLSPLDGPLMAFVVLSTLWPVVSMLLRGVVPAVSDLAAALPVAKLAAFLLLVRLTVRTDAQLLVVARLVMWPAAVLAVVAVLQTLGVGPVVDVLATLWNDGRDPAELTERGTTTLASSIATGDYVVLAMALLAALAVRDRLGRREAVALGLLLGAGVLAAGQFSTWAAAAVVAAVLLHDDTRLRGLARRALPVLAVAALVGLPAFVSRLAQFGDGFGVPRSWLGRWDNLVNFYLPRLGDYQFVLGISPDSVLPAPETWREVIYLEYGYLQLLWVGGLPLLVAFGWLSLAVVRHSRTASAEPGEGGAYAAALHAAWWMVLVLSVIDIHLVLRGAGELLFLFLAVVGGRIHGRTPG